VYSRHASTGEIVTFLVQCDGRCDESTAFPSALRFIAQEAATAVAIGELHPPRHAFAVNMDGERLHLPYRVYYDRDLLRAQISSSHGSVKLIRLCLGTRHYDGYLRQECLLGLLNNGIPWLIPYLLQLAGEYVVEIAEDVANAIVEWDRDTLRAFAMENPNYLATLARRVTSYWNCYHRRAYPDRQGYPGARVLAVVGAAMERSL
jgi:hypothetical protein